MNKHLNLFIAFALVATVISGCKKEKAKSAISSTLDCGSGQYRQAHPKECEGYDRLFTVTKDESDLMKKLSE